MKTSKKIFFDNKFVPILLLTIALLFLFWPTVIKGEIYSLPGLIKSDYLNMAYPFREVYHQDLVSGKMPWWVTKVGNGYPLIAEGQLGAFYPLNLLFFYFFSTNTALNLVLFLHAVIAAIGCYFLVLDLTNSKRSAFFSALVFSMCGFMTTQLVEVNLFLSFSWFPLVLLIYIRFLKKINLGRFLVLTTIFSMQILAGYIPLVFYGWLVLFVIGAWFSKLNWRLQFVNFVKLILPIIFSLVICAVQIFPSLELNMVSNRANGLHETDATAFTYPADGFLSFLGIRLNSSPVVNWDLSSGTPTFTVDNPYEYWSYIGLLTLPFILIGTILLTKYRKQYSWLLIITFWTFIMMLGNTTPVFSWFWYIVPGMKYFRYSVRFLGFVELFFSIIAGLGLYFVLNHLTKKFVKYSLLVSVGYTVLIFVTFIDLYLHWNLFTLVKSKNFWLDKPVIVDVIKNNLDNDFRLGGLPLDYFDPNLDRNWGLQKDLKNFLPADYSLLFGIYTDDINTALPVERQWSLVNRNIPIQNIAGEEYIAQQQPNTNNSDVPVVVDKNAFKLEAIAGVKFFTSFVPLINPDLKLVWSFPLSHGAQLETYILNPSEGTMTTVYPKVVKEYLYELVDSVPRAIFVPNAIQSKSGDNEINQILNDSFNPKSEVIIEGISKDDTSGSGGIAKIIKDEDNKIFVSVASAKGGWFVLSDTYYPGWVATIDGISTKIYRANYAFRAIKVPAGDHNIVFEYNPTYKSSGFLVSIIGLSVFVVLLAIYWMTRTHKS